MGRGGRAGFAAELLACGCAGAAGCSSAARRRRSSSGYGAVLQRKAAALLLRRGAAAAAALFSSLRRSWPHLCLRVQVAPPECQAATAATCRSDIVVGRDPVEKGGKLAFGTLDIGLGSETRGGTELCRTTFRELDLQAENCDVVKVEGELPLSCFPLKWPVEFEHSHVAHIYPIGDRHGDGSCVECLDRL
eukprot:scaffold10096_cov231-Isochrysis_galbana.AAC.8